jgi:RNA recognition motif-containing protein
MRTLGVKCKGQAYLTFESESSAKAALAMSGTTVENTASSDGKKEVNRKELKVKITKMLNGFATKKGSR